MKKLLLLAFFTLSGLIYFSWRLPVAAIEYECGEELPTDEGQLREYIASCNTKLTDLSGQKKTLAEAISYLNTQISLTQAKIASTESELKSLNLQIQDLTGKIESIDYSLDDLTRLFVARIRETYIRKDTWSTSLLMQASGIPDMLRRLEYTQRIRDRDREILIALEKSRLDFNAQKAEKEVKQAEIEALQQQLNQQRSSLSAQKSAKDRLLAETNNDEKRYQQLLAEAQAELVAIKGIIAGLGKEVKVGLVGEGERVASIIVGKSPCSSGTHLHYEVAENQSRANPFQLLKPIDLVWSNEDPPQNGSGSWNWPLESPIRITQGYGHTAYSSRYVNDLHTGIDMVSDNRTVNSVKAGELYQGSMKCGSGQLVYVRVKQTDGYDSYYLHVNY